MRLNKLKSSKIGGMTTGMRLNKLKSSKIGGTGVVQAVNQHLTRSTEGARSLALSLYRNSPKMISLVNNLITQVLEFWSAMQAFVVQFY